MSRSLPHLTLTTSTRALSLTSPIFPTFSPSHPSPLAHDPYLPCEDPRQGGGSTQIPSPTGHEPKVIELEDLEPRRIELGDNYQNPIAEHMEEFGKVGVETSYLQSQMHSEYDSAKRIADSDLEDGELRNMRASQLFLREREENSGSSRRPTASGNQKQWQYRRQGASAQRTQADYSRREGLMSSSSQEPRASGKPDAMFSSKSTEPGNQFEGSIFLIR